VLKFLVADDHCLIREGLRYALEGAFTEVSIVEAANGDEVVIAAATQPDIDLILLDYYMPETDGDDLVAWLIAHSPHVPIVMLSAADDPLLVRRLLANGVTGFLSKNTCAETMVTTLKQVLAGEYVAPETGPPSGWPPGRAVPPQDGSGADVLRQLTDVLRQLTHRQRQVFMLMIEGKTNKDISRELHISENTIKVHVTAVLKVLGVANRIQAVLAVQRLGRLPVD